MTTYRVGEVVMMNWQGWLTVFRVVEVHREVHGDVETIEYRLAMVALEKGVPQWQRPARGD